jgi:ketosteroid isomerase-like protein
MRGKSAIATGQTGIQQFHIESISKIQEINLFGEWAYLWTKLSVVVIPKKGGAPIKRADYTLSVLQKQAGT